MHNHYPILYIRQFDLSESHRKYTWTWDGDLHFKSPPTSLLITCKQRGDVRSRSPSDVHPPPAYGLPTTPADRTTTKMCSFVMFKPICILLVNSMVSFIFTADTNICNRFLLGKLLKLTFLLILNAIITSIAFDKCQGPLDDCNNTSYFEVRNSN